VKSALKGAHFQTANEVKLEIADLMYRVSVDDLQHCFEQWRIHMQQCIDREGKYNEREFVGF
jgi:hypothetical protein